MSYGLCGTILATPGEGDLLARHLLVAAAALGEVDSPFRRRRRIGRGWG